MPATGRSSGRHLFKGQRSPPMTSRQWEFYRQSGRGVTCRNSTVIFTLVMSGLTSVILVTFSSVQSLSHVWLFLPHGLQHARLPCPSPAPATCSNSCRSSQWCHPIISFSVIPSSSCLQSFPASGSFPMSQFFASGGQSIGVSALALVLPMNIEDSFPLEWTSWSSLLSKGLSRIFSNTTVQKHQFFGAQLSL